MCHSHPMPWSREKHREYRRHGDGRDKKRAADAAYQKKNKDLIREKAYARPIAPDAPKTFCCRQCGIEKPFTPEFFTYRPAMKFKLTYKCRACLNAASLLGQTMKMYGMTVEQATKFRERGCEICGSNKKIHIDHCHTTGVVRGTLCTLCNMGIGAFHEDPAKMRSAIAYVEKHAPLKSK